MLSVFLLHVLYPIVFLVAVIIIILNCFVVQKPVRVPRQVEKNNQIIIGLLRKKKFSFQDQGYFLIQTPNKKITVAAGNLFSAADFRFSTHTQTTPFNTRQQEH